MNRLRDLGPHCLCDDGRGKTSLGRRLGSDKDFFWEETRGRAFEMKHVAYL
jgi:hypothetical protein